MTTEDLRECQRTRRWFIGLFVTLLVLIGGVMGRLMVDMAVVKEKVTNIENTISGHLVPRDKRLVLNLNTERVNP